VRAARLHTIGGTPRVEEVDAPAHELVIEVTAAALNPIDISIATGRFYGGAPELPYVIGSEAVGTLPGGRRVWHYGRGSLAERVALADPQSAIDVPDGLADGLALACGIAGLTGWLAVSWRTRILPEDTVLVLGASGCVGATALQAARLLGARRVVGAARRPERIPAAADEVVCIDGSESYPAATVIVDGLWGEPFERALAASAGDVRVVQLGQSAGPSATLQSGWIRGKPASILGHSLRFVPSEVREAAYRELAAHVQAGELHFDVETYDLGELATAWDRQSSGSPGAKIVISI
jgi:NADPH:quinone reductase-like Zn-dependent oxidoreductase